MKIRKLNLVLMVSLLTCSINACGIDLSDNQMALDQSMEDFLESQIEAQYQKYKKPKEDAAYVSYDVTDGLVERFKKVYESGDTSDLNQAEMALYEGLKEALDAASAFSTVIDQEKAVHDWIVLNCQYDYENLQNDSLPETVYTADGVYRYHVAVCDGYQKAFKLAMSILGINCLTVSGTGEFDGQEESHAWNAVEIDGKWYQVDVTWDDPVPDEPGRVKYTYFNVTDSIMREAHSYAFEYVCNSTKYSYMEYYMGDYCASTSEDMDRIMSAAFTSGKTELEVYIAEDSFEELVQNYINFADNYTLCQVVAKAVCTYYTTGERLSDGRECYLVPYTISYSDAPLVGDQATFDRVVQTAHDNGQSYVDIILTGGVSVEDFWSTSYKGFYVRSYTGDGYGIYRIEFKNY